jgi:hypothetical protein
MYYLHCVYIYEAIQIEFLYLLFTLLILPDERTELNKVNSV